ncbi:hypothetical protein ACKWTF_006900 [Chironomus riparius]
MSLFSYLIVLVLLSVIGNLFVIVSLLSNKKTRSAFDSFIINICILDFLIGAFLKSSFVIEDYFEGQQINDTHCYFMTTLMTAAPTIILMTLVTLLFYMIFSSIKKVRIEKLLSPETSFVIIFMMWFLIGGVHLIYHKVFGTYGSICAVEDDILSTTVYCNLTLMIIVLMQMFGIFIIESIKKASDAINLRRPEAVYNNLTIEINNNSVDTEDIDGRLRKLIYVQSILFLLFWIPFYAIRAQYMFDKKTHSLDLIVLQLFFYVIGYFRSAVAPIAVLIVYPESRYLIRKIKEIDYIKITKIFAKSESDAIPA